MKRAGAVLGPVLLAFGISFFLNLVQYDTHLNWGDEGYVWYGVRQTMAGQVPLRDFQSYDPLRYYWAALFTPLFGGGLFGLRWAGWLSQACFLSLGLLALRRVIKNLPGLAVAAALIVLWQFWRFRFFDSGFMMAGVFFALRLIESPTAKRYFSAGLLTGASVLLGINHALYLVIAFTALTLYLEIKNSAPGSRKRPLWLPAGAAIGALPLAAFMFLPGFAEKYWERFVWYGQLLSQGQTDIRSAIQWPWLVRWDMVTQNPAGFWTGFLQYINLAAQGSMFVTLIFFYGLALAAVIRLRKEELRARALFIASFFIGAAYLNHVFARSDVTHLGEGFFPVLAGCAAASTGGVWIRSPWARSLLMRWLIALTIFGALPLSILFFKAMVPLDSMTPYRIGKDSVWMFKSDAWQTQRLKDIVAKHVPQNEPLFIAPMLTSLYCVLDRQSPTHQIYFMISEPMPIQQRVLKELEEKKVNWAIIGDVALDGREELTFSNTHGSLADHLFENFEPVPERGLPVGHLLLRRRSR